MTKKTLQEWYRSNDISYSEKEKLNKIGISDYDYRYLEDLNQILRCEDWAQTSSEIRNNLNGRIRKITFFTPNFNDSKPDASNYSCAIVTDGSGDNWVIVYRPSYVSNLPSDVLIKKVDISVSEAERKLNGDYPIVAVMSSNQFSTLLNYLNRSFVRSEDLPYDAKNSPDKYVLPLDIVIRPINDKFAHYAIYLGDKWVVEMPGSYKSVKFSTWNDFCSGGSLGSSSGSSGGSGKISLVHPKIPYKRKEEIIRHIAKALNHNYGGCLCHFYNSSTNNCENLANGCVLGINISFQGVVASNFGPIGGLVSVFSLSPISTVNNVKNAFQSFAPSVFGMENIESRVLITKDHFDSLTHSDCYYEKNKIKQYAQSAENNRSYNRYKSQIEQEKFQERIEVNPKDWCKIS